MTKTYKEIFTPKVIINSAISGFLVLFGAMSSGELTGAGIGLAFGAAGVAFCTQLRNDIFPTSKKANGGLGLFQFY